jgi:hypothetical protein
MKFTGQRLDTTGLYFYGARYYDPGIGRFISPDPIVHTVPLPEGIIIEPLVVSLSNTQNQFKGNETRSLYREIANPQELNRYSYVLNNPLKYIDPTGNQVNAAAQLSQDAWQLSNSLPPGWPRWVAAGGAVVIGFVGWIWYQASNNSSNNDTGKSKSDNSGNTANGDPNGKLPKESKKISINDKISSQMEKRGWTKESIQNTVDESYTTRISKVYWNDNSATAYYNQDGSYVVIEDSTGNTVQISNRFDPDWIPDPNIIDPYIP